MDKIWLENPDLYTSVMNESRKYVLYPKLRKIINEFNPQKLFDYGSGDGSFLNYLKPTCEVGLYDISKKAVSLARKNVSFNANFFSSKTIIPSNHYDLVNFSLVLMAISTKRKIISTFKEIKRIKKKDGLFVISVTHPCFREKKFSSFYTNYTTNNKENYFSEGNRFEVFLFDLINRNKISFFDYHWSLSFTLNILLELQFQIIELIELKDWAPNKKYYNKKYPPYLIILCK